MDAHKYHVGLDGRGKSNASLREGIKNAIGKKEEPKSHKRTPSSLETPSFLMNYPLTIDNKVMNNALMKKDQGKYNYDKAFKQWEDLYRLIVTEGSVVYVLPSELPPLQDLPFVANLGIYLPHLRPDTIIISNYKSAPRKGEDDIGIKFFKMNNYAIHQPTTHFEGEADLKWMTKNIYVGGYGIRTDQKSFNWMMDKFDMEIIQCKMSDEKLYHFDCQFFPLTSNQAMASTSAFRPEDLKQVERHVDIVEVPKQFKYDGWTNSLKLGKKILCGDIPDKASIKAHDTILEKLGYTTVGVDLSEFAKSGGDLSCLCMHLSYTNR
jgi:N-dimethylarginine dimethylaminohydrolase